MALLKISSNPVAPNTASFTATLLQNLDLINNNENLGKFCVLTLILYPTSWVPKLIGSVSDLVQTLGSHLSHKNGRNLMSSSDSEKVVMEIHNISNPELPGDVIIEILSWLPVQSILKFRCVCKSWLSSISSQQFVKTHLRNSKQDSNFRHHRIILNCRSNFKQFSIPSLLYEPIIDAFDMNDVAYNPKKLANWVVGSCDGLICAAINKKHMILWNPSTRIFKKLPAFDVELNGSGFFAYGFGFDKASDDYKVVGFFDSSWGLLEQTVKVYSLKSDQWKTIKSFEDCWPMNDPATFANGKLYWNAYFKLEFKCVWDIIFLDLETDELGLLQVPNYVKDCSYSKLGESEGCLYVLCIHLTSADLWIIHDYGIGKETWTKMVSIPYPDDFWRNSHKTTFYVLKNGEVLLHSGSKFLIFDAKDGSFRYSEIRSPEIRSSCDFMATNTYVESLVSPVGL
ncbi:hypothetical protein DH2020_032395 [Rehmannia glutinosa]|uniref:F-box domain-containing protein n=1 Tax=Rehmannia glutinosa TaxID=99300 RepID=A0ABR0VHI8_REHGL